MGITAQDIQNEGFEHSLRGYDVGQVDAFLERVAAEVDAMNRIIADLESQLTAANEQLAAVVGPEVDTASAEQIAAAENTSEELDKANAKMADALVRAEDAEGKLKAALQRAEASELQVGKLKEQLAEKNKLDSAISEAFISAQRSADALKEEARAEGERIYREAEGKAREFIREALAKKASIYSEIDALQKSSDSFRQRYIGMVEGFAAQAKESFSNLEPPEIPDNIVNEMLPDMENIQAQPAAGAEDHEEPAAEDESGTPRLTPDDIPALDVPKSSIDE